MLSEKVLKVALSYDEVEKRIKAKQFNKKSKSKSKSIRRIFFDNIVTLFNFLNLFLMLLLVLVGSYKNMLFMGVVICNTIIGIVQEIRSKITVDKLSILSTNKVSVVRNGKTEKIFMEEIVIDDVIILSAGDQVPADCRIIDGICFANESLLTGESELIEKTENEQLFSGSFVTAGKIFAKVIHIGKDNFATKIHSEASYTRRINSEIMSICNKILTFCSIAIFPVGTALFVNQYFFNNIDIKLTTVSVVAALVGMIPEGMILLTSTVLAVAVIRLAKKQVLVQQLYCIETLARVDVLCLDKTGTITTGEMNVVDIKYLEDDSDKINVALKSLAVNSIAKNSTISAIENYLNCENINAIDVVPFCSERKWSAVTLENKKTYILGATEFIYNQSNTDLYDHIDNIDDTYRVLVLSESNELITSRNLPENLRPIALIIIKDEVRKNAEDTINYFREQGVNLKVISGDNHKTVEMIAKSVGIENAEKSIDASTLETDEELFDACEKYTVFGRVTPQQKKKLIVALKEKGHTVAMTGDGVNDVLALKEADCSIAMACGSDAAKNISQLVLVNNDFSSMPKVVAEGRRSINNIQRSSSLFIVKTLYSLCLAIAFVFLGTNYPFEPIQLSLVSAFTIGLPSFVLALEPNHSIVKGSFLKNIILNALPGAIMVFTNLFLLGVFHSYFSQGEVSTIAVIMTSLIGVMLVFRLSLPLNFVRTSLLLVIVCSLVLAMTVFGNFFSMVHLSLFALVVLFVAVIATVIIYNLLFNLFHKLAE